MTWVNGTEEGSRQSIFCRSVWFGVSQASQGLVFPFAGGCSSWSGQPGQTAGGAGEEGSRAGAEGAGVTEQERRRGNQHRWWAARYDEQKNWNGSQDVDPSRLIFFIIIIIIFAWQPKRTTGPLCPGSPPSSPASIRTLSWISLRSTAGSARGCTTCGCVSSRAQSSPSVFSLDFHFVLPYLCLLFHLEFCYSLYVLMSDWYLLAVVSHSCRHLFIAFFFFYYL